MRPLSRRSVLTGATAIGLSALAAPASAARPSTHLVLDYQPPQPTGWPQAPGQSLGGHTTTKDFRYQDQAYRISLLTDDPVYSPVPADPEVDFARVLATSWGMHYSFRYRGGLRGRSRFRVLMHGVFAEEPGQMSPMRYGGGIHVCYEPGPGGPPLSPCLQWIQVIRWNASHGPMPSEVDNSWRANPFYTNGGHTSVNGKETVSFHDVPQKGIMGPLTLDDKVSAETFLVQDRGNGLVDIYGGIRWGWQVTAL